MFITKKFINRRTFLRGTGVGLALPFLNAMIPAFASELPAKHYTAFVYFPHGAIMNKWTPTTSGSDFNISPILKPLEKHKEYLTVISGTRNKGAESSSPHAIIAGTWLGCTSPAASALGKGGITIDQLIAQYIGQNTPFPSIELSTESGTVCDPAFGCGYGNTISFRTPKQPLPMEDNPRKMFFKLFGQGDTEFERASIIDEKSSILDAIRENTLKLQSKLGVEDKSALDSYLDSVREVERRVHKMQTPITTNVKLPEAPVGIPEDFNEHLNIMFDLIILAFQSNLTQVATFMMAREVSMRTYNNVGVSEAFHPLSHHQNDPSKLERLEKIQTYHSQVFAKFIDKLYNIDDGGKRLLDRSTILFGSNMSNSDLHNNDPLPLAILGKANGTIKGNTHIVMEKNTPSANVMHTILDRVGVQTSKFADSTGIINI